MGRIQRGSGLPAALLLGAIGLTLAFSLIAVAFHHLNVAGHLGKQYQARYLCESVAALAIQQLILDPDTRRGTFDRTVTGGNAVLTFDPLEASRRGIPLSRNNFGGDTAVPGWQGDVPREGAQLVVVGEYQGVRRRLEVVLHLPSFAWVVGSSGPIETLGPTLVAQVESWDRLAAGVSQMELESLQPGDIGSNSPAAPALRLSGLTRVTGDAVACGQVELLPGALVLGSVQPGANPAALPDLDVAEFDPERQGRPGVEYLAQETLQGETLNRFTVRRGRLSAREGLHLDGGVLFVEGDLEVQGGVHGVGAVFVTGRTVIRGGSSLSTDNQVALVSQGDVDIRGDGAASVFRGVSYTEGNFSAREITLLGSFVANKPDEGGSRVVMEDVSVVHEPEAVDVAFSVLVPISGSQQSYAVDVLDSSGMGRSTINIGPGLSDQLAAAPNQTIPWSDGTSVSGTMTLRPDGMVDVSHPNLPGGGGVINPNGQASTSGGSSPPTTVWIDVPFNFNLNEFLALEDRMAVLRWVER
ncbi:MAG: hypothetical protein AB1758_31725 [Candidatus Eremiobacterota bacterium]